MIKTVEAVTFKLVAGTVPSAFVVANEKVNVWIQRQPGFLKRELTQLEDESWLDVVHWQSVTQAKEVGQRLMTELGDSEWMAMIDPASIKLQYGELQLAI